MKERVIALIKLQMCHPSRIRGQKMDYRPTRRKHIYHGFQWDYKVPLKGRECENDWERERDYDLLTSSKAKCELWNQMLEK